MEQFLHENAFGVFSLLAGAVVSYIFYLRSIREKAICFGRETAVLFSAGQAGDLPKLEISYGGQPIQNIARTRICIWNSGNEVIERNNFVAAAPLCIVPHLDENDSDKDTDVLLLDCRVEKASRKESNCSAEISADNKHVLLGFDYLEPDEGYVVDIVHSKRASFNLSGAIKGVKTFRQSKENFLDTLVDVSFGGRRRRNMSRGGVLNTFIRVYVFATMVAMSFLGFAGFISSGACTRVGFRCATGVGWFDAILRNDPPPELLGWFIGITFGIGGALGVIATIVSLFSKRMPKELVASMMPFFRADLNLSR